MSFDESKRSELMSRIRGKNTKPELIVFRYLSTEKIYFQKHYSKVAGKPDIALPRKKLAVFVDGDFWHGKELQRLIDRGGSQTWIDKISKNIDRDKTNQQMLESNGWELLRVWESDIMRLRTRDAELEKIKEFLTSK